MTVKEYCDFSLYLRQSIDYKISLINASLSNCSKITSSFSFAPAHAGTLHPFADSVDFAVDLEQSILFDLSSFNSMLSTIARGLLQLDNRSESAVLKCIYIDGLSFASTAEQLHFSKSSVYRFYHSGLTSLIISDTAFDFILSRYSNIVNPCLQSKD